VKESNEVTFGEAVTVIGLILLSVKDIYDAAFHLLRFLLGNLSEPLAFGADNLSIAVANQFLILLKYFKILKSSF